MKNYVELAIRTESVISSITNIDFRLLHASLGISTEIGELVHNRTYLGDSDLQKLNLIEELGDLNWYIAIACDVLNLDFNRMIEANISKVLPNNLDVLVIKSSELLDLFKKNIYYRKNFDYKRIIMIIEDIVSALIELIKENDLNLDEILDKNIKKLTARYPNKFDSNKAINRNLDAEHKTLL